MYLTDDQHVRLTVPVTHSLYIETGPLGLFNGEIDGNHWAVLIGSRWGVVMLCNVLNKGLGSE